MWSEYQIKAHLRSVWYFQKVKRFEWANNIPGQSCHQLIVLSGWPTNWTLAYIVGAVGKFKTSPWINMKRARSVYSWCSNMFGSAFIYWQELERVVLKFCTRFLALGFLALGRSAICVNLKLPKKPSLFMIWRGQKRKEWEGILRSVISLFLRTDLVANWRIHSSKLHLVHSWQTTRQRQAGESFLEYVGNEEKRLPIGEICKPRSKWILSIENVSFKMTENRSFQFLYVWYELWVRPLGIWAWAFALHPRLAKLVSKKQK